MLLQAAAGAAVIEDDLAWHEALCQQLRPCVRRLPLRLVFHVFISFQRFGSCGGKLVDWCFLDCL
jgi:hypothetical protein